MKFRNIAGPVFALACVVVSTLWASHGEFIEGDAAAKKFTLPTNFVIKTWAAEPQLANPVAFTFNRQGRAFVAETYRLNNSVFDITQNTNWLAADLSFETVSQRIDYMSRTFGANVGALTKFSERLQMVVDSDGDGTADDAKTISEDFRSIESGIAAGVLAQGTNLWFACIPDLWRFFDANHDGIPDKPVKLHSGFGVHIGVTGHDLHGLTMGPDGRLYFSVGDRGFNVEAEGRHYKFPHTGGVLRCEPDGSNLEVFATGMRNPQELAFDEFGNLFAGDNDTAGADDCRLLYVVEHGDYGWRTPYQHLKDFGPWVQENLWRGGKDGLLPHSGNPAQGPSGLAYYPGTGLPTQYDNHFFMCDFPGGIWSFQVVQNGASYSLTNKSKFVWNCWPTDVEFGPEPGIYFSDWVAGWTMPTKGRIYHLQSEGLETNRDITNSLKENFGNKSESELISFLSSRDYRIRQKAQFELVRQDKANALLKVAFQGSGRAQIHALWGLGQISRFNQGAVTWKQIQTLVSSKESEVRAQVAKLAGEARLKDATRNLLELLNDAEPRVGFFAAQSLVLLKSEEAIPALITFAKKRGSDPFLLHPVAIGLSSMSEPQELKELAGDSNLHLRKAVLTAMRRNHDPNAATFLNDKDLSEEAARAIYDGPITNAFPALAALINNQNLPPATLLRAVHANYRLGDERSLQALGEFALRTNAPESLRKTVLELIGSWPKPDDIDHVVGFHRPLASRSEEAARVQARLLFEKLKTTASADLLVTLLNTAQKLDCGLPVEDLLRLFNDQKLNSTVRIAALEAMGTRDPGKVEPAVLQAITSPEENMRVLAARLASKIPSEKVTIMLCKIATDDKSISVRQQALQSLKGSATLNADKLVQNLAQQIKTEKLPAALRLEALELINTSPRTELKPDEDTAAGWLQKALIAGGNATEGGRIFRERADVSCSRCHAVRGNGGTVGPDLTQIGKANGREYLLEAIQFPNKHIAKGFEQAIIQKKDGTVLAGLIQKETDDAVTLNSPEDGVIEIKKSEIESRKNALSAMPEGLAEMLTPLQLRDLVEYLATLK